MPEVVDAKAKLNISKLELQEDGNYAIKINGEIFGVINAQTEAKFLLKSGEMLMAGAHTVKYGDRKLKVDVKDLTPGTTFYDLRDVEAKYREQMRTERRTLDMDELKVRLKNAKKHNDETMAEILGRVVVFE